MTYTFNLCLYIVSADVHKRHTSIENCLIFLKPNVSSCPKAVEHVVAALAQHHLKVVQHTKISGAELQSRKVIESQYANACAFACTVAPSAIVLSASEHKQFRATFVSDAWSDVVHAGVVMNELEACKFLRVDSTYLYDLWGRAEMKIRLRKGLYCAKLDRNCALDAVMRKKLHNPIFVINGFYRSMESAYYNSPGGTDVLICEWNEAETSWAALLDNVVGASNPVTAQDDSIRRSLSRTWESLGMEAAPTAEQNGLHVSNSAFEGLVERLLWKKGSMLYTDLFGSRLLSARLKSAQISEWTQNPTVDGKPLFEHLHAKNSADCIEFLMKQNEQASKK